MSVRRSTRVSQKVVIESKEVFVASVAIKKRARSASLSSLSTLSGEDAPVAAEKASVKSTRKRNTKAKTEEEPKVEDYPSRVDNAWKIGAHVSGAGGVENVILNAAAVKANAFALFVKSQRKWTSPALSESSIRIFKQRMESFGYSPKHVLPHGSYLINLGNPDREKREKSYDCFIDDLKRCEQLNLTLYNFHPGSTVGSATPEESTKLIADCLNRAHKETNFVTTVIENMAGAGNIIGGPFSHLASIIEHVEEKSRVGVCLDTCHAFAAGYDIRQLDGYNSVVEEFDREVGLKYLKAWHINDSKTALGSHKDRHENLGCGEIGLNTFSFIVHDPRMQNLPLILETPTFEQPEVWAHEIEMLNKLSSLEPNASEEHEALVKELKEVVKKAQTSSGKGTKSGGKKSPAKKRKKKTDGDEEDDASGC